MVKSAITCPSNNVDPPNHLRILIANFGLTPTNKIEMPRLLKIALAPEEPYELGVDGSGGGVKDVDLERHYHAGVLLLDLKHLGKVFDHSPRPGLSPKSTEERTGVVNNGILPWRL